jgi:hypothetical protein
MRNSFAGRLAGLAVMVALAAGAAACDSDDTTPPTTPTQPTLVTETFVGTLSPGGAATFAFSVTTAGGISASLRSLAPDSGVQVGLSLGTWNGVSCQVVLTNDQATVGQGITGAASAAGHLCVRVFDVGQLTQVSTFEITVAHP